MQSTLAIAKQHLVRALAIATGSSIGPDEAGFGVALLVGDRVPACPTALARSADPAGGFQFPQQREYQVAIRVSALSQAERGEPSDFCEQ